MTSLLVNPNVPEILTMYSTFIYESIISLASNEIFKIPAEAGIKFYLHNYFILFVNYYAIWTVT